MNKQKLINIFNQHSPVTPMTKEDTGTMFSLMMSEDINLNCDINEIDNDSEIYNHFEPLINSFQGKIFLSRLKKLTTLRISLGALIMLMLHAESPGKVVMMVFYCHYKLPENTLITVDALATNLFPMGFFSNEQLNNIWNAQKVGEADRKGYSCIGAPDNMIDYLESWRD